LTWRFATASRFLPRWRSSSHGAVGPVGSTKRLVLNDRLGRLELATGSPLRRGFVAPPSRARGMEFDVVIVPGLAERMFPRKLNRGFRFFPMRRARG